MATFCRKCGAPNEPDARFCESCGSPMPVSMPPAADVAHQAASAEYQGRSQPPGRRWVPYAVGALAILGIGIGAAVFFAPNGPLAGLTSTARAKAPGAKESTAQGNSAFSGLPSLFGGGAGGGAGNTSSGRAGTPSNDSSKPSHTQALKHLETQCFQANDTRARCITRLTHFEKTNGVAQDLMGMKAYIVIGTVRYEFTEDAIEKTYLGMQKVPGRPFAEPAYAVKVVAPKGTTKEEEVKIVFIQTENGWQAQKK